jgi:hypothetical protein
MRFVRVAKQLACLGRVSYRRKRKAERHSIG